MPSPLIPFTKTLKLPEPPPEPAEAPAPMRMMTMAAEPAEPAPSIHTLHARAVAELVTEMQAAGITDATGEWIRSSTHAPSGTEDTIEAYGILPRGANARFTGGPLDGQTQPSRAEPMGDHLPRLTRPDGSFYILSSIDYTAGEYEFTWHPVDAEPFTWTR